MNTRFYHHTYKIRKSQYKITQIIKVDEPTTTDLMEIKRMVKEFFKTLYSKENPYRPPPSSVLFITNKATGAIKRVANQINNE